MIRIATEADVPEILAIYAPYILTTTCTFEYDVPTEDAFLQRFRDITQQFPWLVWEEDGQVLGYAYASAPFGRAAYRWCAEDSLYLRPEARGRGIGKRLLLALEGILILQGYRMIYALVTSENSDSLEFHRRMGYIPAAQFRNCGYKFGRWLSVTWLDKELNSVVFPNDFPTPWPALMHSDKKISDILGTLSLS